MAKSMQLTTNQKLVFDALRHASGPLSAYALLDRLRIHGINAPVQVYRALKNLVERGLAHRLETINAYVSCSHPEGCGSGFSVFVICDRCGHIGEFVDDVLDGRLGDWSKREDFHLANATIEIHGVCSTCRALAESSSPLS